MNSEAIMKWILTNIVPIVIVVMGILIISKAQKKDIGGAFSMIVVILLGCAVAGGAALFVAFGGSMAHLAFKG